MTNNKAEPIEEEAPADKPACRQKFATKTLLTS